MMCNIARSLAGGGGVVIGSYTGDFNERTISLGFTPRALVIGIQNGAAFETTNNIPSIVVTQDAPFSDSSHLPWVEIVDGGFKLYSNDSTARRTLYNRNYTYNYIAFT